MPAGDRTGPDGQGPLTGRGAGYCADNDRPGYANVGPEGPLRRFFRGGGLGRRSGGRGRGMGRGRSGR